MSHRINNIISHLKTPTNSLTSSECSFKKKPIIIVCTGAAGNIGYSLLFMIASGRMCGYDQPIELRLLDLPNMEKVLKGVEMELNDCAFPLLTKTVCTSDYKTAFTDCDVALLVGAKPRGPGMQRGDLLSQNAAIFKGQGQALNNYASRNVKVVVVGNPANTNAMIAMVNAPSIPRENFTALTRLDQNRAIAQLSMRLKTDVSSIKNVIIWGNHSKTQYPDINHAVVLSNGSKKSIREAVKDDSYLNGSFIETVQDRGAAIIAARKLSSAASAANAVVDHMYSWLVGTAPGEFVSMGVYSDGSYGAPKGVIYSFPVTCKNGKWTIVQGLKIDDFSKKLMKITGDELVDEQKAALGN